MKLRQTLAEGGATEFGGNAIRGSVNVMHDRYAGGTTRETISASQYGHNNQGINEMSGNELRSPIEMQ